MLPVPAAAPRAVSSVGQSASLTPRMPGVRVPHRPPHRRPPPGHGLAAHAPECRECSGDEWIVVVRHEADSAPVGGASCCVTLPVGQPRHLPIERVVLGRSRGSTPDAPADLARSCGRRALRPGHLPLPCVQGQLLLAEYAPSRSVATCAPQCVSGYASDRCLATFCSGCRDRTHRNGIWQAGVSVHAKSMAPATHRDCRSGSPVWLGAGALS